ncbi:Txe/YoeB family addiction module toxin [Paraburkholderia dinghuensis]|uniref:Putative mRNA interferase YoeB n=1 Tax=Paraburkholderia dinghuensis TaxID=2305225 RepID=A0A3N6N9T4_9BURK|nr:Txe/YoeB family addiction module toxin [Paraburkholderia dinghuensis]
MYGRPPAGAHAHAAAYQADAGGRSSRPPTRRPVQRSPFEGVGKPEPLKENLTGFWSRRIDETNRLVYEVAGTQINIVSCRYHY